METIIQNQGLQHIVEKSLMCLDKESFNSFGLVNSVFKGITESPRVLRVLKKRKLVSVIKETIALNDAEWKKELFKLLHDQSLNQLQLFKSSR